MWTYQVTSLNLCSLTNGYGSGKYKANNCITVNLSRHCVCTKSRNHSHNYNVCCVVWKTFPCSWNTNFKNKSEAFYWNFENAFEWRMNIFTFFNEDCKHDSRNNGSCSRRTCNTGNAQNWESEPTIKRKRITKYIYKVCYDRNDHCFASVTITSKNSSLK